MFDARVRALIACFWSWFCRRARRVPGPHIETKTYACVGGGGSADDDDEDGRVLDWIERRSRARPSMCCTLAFSWGWVRECVGILGGACCVGRFGWVGRSVRELDFVMRVVPVWRHLVAKHRAIDGCDVRASGRSWFLRLIVRFDFVFLCSLYCI